MNLRGLAALAIAFSSLPVAVRAQQALAVGAGVGVPLCCGGGGRDVHGMLAVGVAPRGAHVEYRLDALFLGWTSRPGSPWGLQASVIAPVGSARVQPYVVGGAGWFHIGRPGARSGLHAGAGVRARLGRAIVFGEALLHAATRNMATVGVAF